MTKNERNRLYWASNRSAINSRRRERYHCDKKKESLRKRKYYMRTRPIRLAYCKAYRDSHVKQSREAIKRKLESNVNFRIRMTLSTRIRNAIRGTVKSARTRELLGCSVEFVKDWLESKFTDGMTWGNYGKWHVDHIIPCAEFDLTKPEQQLRCFHYTNLQPLWAIDNFKKNKFSPANAQLAPPTLTDGRAVIAETMRP